jgi:hypothetical protein
MQLTITWERCDNPQHPISNTSTWLSKPLGLGTSIMQNQDRLLVGIDLVKVFLDFLQDFGGIDFDVSLYLLLTNLLHIRHMD